MNLFMNDNRIYCMEMNTELSSGEYAIEVVYDLGKNEDDSKTFLLGITCNKKNIKGILEADEKQVAMVFSDL